MTRLAALLLWSALAGGAPAWAQQCEASVSSPVGEVVVTRTARLATATWIVERGNLHGEETSQFARPALELDFVVKDGAVGELKAAYVAITRISSPDGGRAPPLSSVDVRASLDGGKALVWRGDEDGEGHRKLAEALRRTWPGRLEVELVPTGGGKAHASAVFDLTKIDRLGELAKQAYGKCRFDG